MGTRVAKDTRHSKAKVQLSYRVGTSVENSTNSTVEVIGDLIERLVRPPTLQVTELLRCSFARSCPDLHLST